MAFNALAAVAAMVVAPKIAKATGLTPDAPQAPVMTAAPSSQNPGGTSTGSPSVDKPAGTATGGTPEAEAQYKAQQQRRKNVGGISSTIATPGGKQGLGEVPAANMQTKTLLGY